MLMFLFSKLLSLPREGGGPPLVVEGARRVALARIPCGYSKKAFALSLSLPREGGGPPLVVEGARRAALVRIPYGYIKKALALSLRHAFACHLPVQGGLAFHAPGLRISV